MKYRQKLKQKLIHKWSLFTGTKDFSSEIFQNYLLFIPAKRYIKYYSGTTPIDLWKSNRMSEKNIEIITKQDSNFALTFADHHLFSSFITV